MRDDLATIAGVTTCKIGIESGLSPADYPMIRVVPQSATHAAALTRKKLMAYVFFGMAAAESDNGLEDVYEDLCSLEETIVDKLETSTKYAAQWTETIFDEDVLDDYKVMCAKFEVSA
jgi:hypothetical protein